MGVLEKLKRGEGVFTQDLINEIERLRDELAKVRNSDEHNFRRWQRDAERLAAVTLERDECLQTIARLDEANLCMHTELAAMKEQTK